MIRKQRNVLPLALLLLFEVAAIFGLSALGKDPSMQIDWSHFSTWVNSSLDVVIAPILLYLAKILAWWMLISTMLTVFAQISKVPGLIRATSSFTLPSVRRLVDGAMAASVITTSVIGMLGATSAFAAETPSATTGTVASSAENANRASASAAPGDGFFATPNLKVDKSNKSETTPPPAAPSQAEKPDTKAATPAVPSAPAAPKSENGHTVKRGENLWTIARDHLAAQQGVKAADLKESEIRAYWVKVVNANKDSLRSHDPHWIFPGEQVKLP